jgi:hypothetical protein
MKHKKTTKTTSTFTKEKGKHQRFFINYISRTPFLLWCPSSYYILLLILFNHTHQPHTITQRIKNTALFKKQKKKNRLAQNVFFPSFFFFLPFSSVIFWLVFNPSLYYYYYTYTHTNPSAPLFLFHSFCCLGWPFFLCWLY